MKQEIKAHHQITLRREVCVHGVGLHSGAAASVTVKPALPNSGILFIRKDLETPVAIPATFEFVTQTKLATTIGIGEVTISTVEHLLSAFRLLGIDNAVVEVEGPEVPIMDGSAMEFCKAFINAGFHDQAVPKRVAVLKKRVEIRKGDKVASIEPSHELKIHARIEWNHPSINVQEFNYTVGKNDYREIADARTFGFMHEVEMLQKMGLARGGSLENAVVLDQHGVINPNGLRHADEFVRHKVLDAIGDFALSPTPFVGNVVLNKAGHELHKELVAAIFANPDNYEVKSLVAAQAAVGSEAGAHAPMISEEAFPWLNSGLQGAF